MKQQEQLHADKELLMCVAKEVVNETKEGLGRDEECRIPLEGLRKLMLVNAGLFKHFAYEFLQSNLHWA